MPQHKICSVQPEALFRICFCAPLTCTRFCTREIISTWISIFKNTRHLIEAQSALYQPTTPFWVQHPPWSRFRQTPLVLSMKSATLSNPLSRADMLAIGLVAPTTEPDQPLFEALKVFSNAAPYTHATVFFMDDRSHQSPTYKIFFCPMFFNSANVSASAAAYMHGFRPCKVMRRAAQ